MKVTVTKRHIQAAKLSNLRTPVEIAVMELDCFEEVSLSRKEDGSYLLHIDGERIALPKKINQELDQFAETQHMKAVNFDLPVEEDVIVGEDELFLESFDDSFSLDFL
ncbi:MAG: hypothetical protein AAFR61_01950 [Bacteroidota bacterium]